MPRQEDNAPENAPPSTSEVIDLSDAANVPLPDDENDEPLALVDPESPIRTEEALLAC